MYSSNFSLELSLYFLLMKASMITAGKIKQNRTTTTTTTTVKRLYIYKYPGTSSSYTAVYVLPGRWIGKYCRRETKNECASEPVWCIVYRTILEYIYIYTDEERCRFHYYAACCTLQYNIIRYIIL